MARRCPCCPRSRPGWGAPNRSAPVWRFAAQCDVQGTEQGAAVSTAAPPEPGAEQQLSLELLEPGSDGGV